MTLNLDAAGIILVVEPAADGDIEPQRVPLSQQIAVCLDLMAEHSLTPYQLEHRCRRMLWPESVTLQVHYWYVCPVCWHRKLVDHKMGTHRCDCCGDGQYCVSNHDKPVRALRDAAPQIAWPKWYKPSPQRKTCNRHVLAGRHPTGAELGAEGETCGSCRHRNFDTSPYKCALGRFTRGPATDVLLKWRRCARWQKRRPFGIGAPEIRT